MTESSKQVDGSHPGRNGALPPDQRLVCRFGTFTFDAGARVLYQDGKPLPLTRKTLDTLAVLLERAGHAVTKQELLNAIWPNQLVDEVNLSQHISLLRKAFGAADGAPEYIHTFPGKGYQFVCPVQWEMEPPGVAPEASPRQKGSARNKRLIVGGAAVGCAIALLAGLSLWPPRRTAAPPSVSKRLPLVRLPGAKFHPALSADGKLVAFVWDRGQGEGTCVYVVRPFSEPAVVPGSCGNPSSPCWSPDGKRLAYLRHRTQTSEVVVTGDGLERIVARLYPVRDLVAYRMLDWSPDGKWLAASDKTSPSEVFSIYLISPDDGSKHPLNIKKEEGVVGDLDPKFSPEGARLAFVRMRHRLRKDVFVVSVSGEEPRLVARDQEKVGGIGWTPDGSSVLYSSNKEGDHRLYRVAVDTRESKPDRDPSGIYGDNPLEFAISAQSRRLAYVVAGDDLNIWRLDLQARRESPDRWVKLIASSGEDAAPQFSPDGTKVCFTSDRSGAEQLWISEPDGSRAAQLTNGDLRPGLGRWSPDGRSIVFNGIDKRVYAVPSAGGSPKSIALSTPCSLVGFMANPNWLLGSCEHQISKIAISSGAPLHLTTNGGQYAIASRDGRYVFYTRARMSPEIWRVSMTGSTETLVTNRLMPGCFGCWTPARNGLYYIGEGATGAPELRFLEFQDRRDTIVSAIPYRLPPLGTAHISLSPDEKYILTVRRDSISSDLSLVAPFE